MAKRDAIIGVIVIIFSLFMMSNSLKYGYSADYGAGPGFFPFWLSVALIGCSLIMIVKSVIVMRTGDQEADEEHRIFTSPLAIIGGLGLLFLVALVFEAVGFVISLSVAMTAYVKLVKQDHPWSRSILIGVVSAVLIYGLFSFGLGINLPRGVLPI